MLNFTVFHGSDPILAKTFNFPKFFSRVALFDKMLGPSILAFSNSYLL